MADPFRRQTIETWVSDFAETPAFDALPAPAKEYASEVLVRFLDRACAVRDVEPGEVEEGDLKPALLEGVGSLDLPASVRAVVPRLCRAFLTALEAQGRLAGGATLGRTVRVLKGAYDERTGDVREPITNPGSKIGRNDPCPCGSGLKYKKCCMRR
ncbi:MAG: SEC-C metal-binding domain-containing protein [Planctomycetota bacterium]